MLRRENQNDRELALRKYFEVPTKEDDKNSSILMIMGAGLVVMGLIVFSQRESGSDVGVGTVLLVLLGLLLGFIGYYKRSTINSRYEKALAEVQPQPADHEVDAWLQQSLQELVAHARRALNLSRSEGEFADPIVISAPTLNATYGIPADDLKWRKGTDGRLRFAIFNVMVVFLTERHLVAYTCNLNFIRNVRLNENTREYHYQDVVSVATFEWSQAFTLPTGEKLSTKQVFRLSVASGEYIEVELDTDILRKAIKQEDVPVMGADKAVATIRAMIRDKKASQVMALGAA